MLVVTNSLDVGFAYSGSTDWESTVLSAMAVDDMPSRAAASRNGVELLNKIRSSGSSAREKEPRRRRAAQPSGFI